MGTFVPSETQFFFFSILNPRVLSACLCSIISLHYRVVLVRTRDDVWYVVPVLVISTVEFNIGIICSCLPTLPALFRRSTRTSKPSYNNPDSGVSGSGHAAGAGGGVAAAAAGSGGAGSSKQGFGRLDAAGSQDSVAALEAGRREGDGSEGGFEMEGVGGEDERKREWFRQARM